MVNFGDFHPKWHIKTRQCFDILLILKLTTSSVGCHGIIKKEEDQIFNKYLT